MAGLGWVSVVASSVAVALIATSCGNTKNHPPRGVGGGADGGAESAAAGSPSLAGAGTDLPIAPLPGELGRRDGQPLLGGKCGKDADCGGDGMRCLTGNEDYLDGEGAPPGGVCTTACQNDENCRAFDATAVCATLGEAPLVKPHAEKTVQRLCMLGCSPGAPSGNAKCHGRTDLACRPFAPDGTTSCIKDEECAAGTLCYRGVCRESACGPRCNSDDDCSGVRRCNPFTGLCDELPPTPVPLGLPCLGELDTTAVCGGGNCLDVFAMLPSETGPHLTRVKEMCTQSCTLGTVCGNGAGACVSPKLANYAIGDIGYCLQKCECDADCLNPADRCRAWAGDQVAAHYGSRGRCDYAPPGTPSLTCDDGQGGSGAGGPVSGGGAGGAD